MMKRTFIAVMAAFTMISSCKCKHSNSKENIVAKQIPLDEQFKKLKLPLSVQDTALRSAQYDAVIDKSAIAALVPDSVVNAIFKNRTTQLHPVGTITNKTNVYYLVGAQSDNTISWLVLAFDLNKKYLNYLRLISNKNTDGYNYQLTINTEPTFFIRKNKKSEQAYLLYTNKGYGFSQSAKKFNLYIDDTNENLPEEEVFNPLDTMPKTFKYSGDYKVDKKNFLALRDGRRNNEYQFFLHFDKTDIDPNSKGELKGYVTMVSANAGLYQKSGDPCVINFDMKENSVRVAEQGNCANYRGSNTELKDNFEKIREKKKK